MSQDNGYFPLFVSLNNKKIVVVGGGRIAARRIRTLAEFSCEIVVIAIRADRDTEDLCREHKLTLLNRSFEPEDIKGAYFVIAATDDEKVNDHVCECCRHENCMVNHAGNKDKSDFYFPGIVKEDHLVIGVTASGCNHSQAKETTAFLKKAWLERDGMKGRNNNAAKTEKIEKQ